MSIISQGFEYRNGTKLKVPVAWFSLKASWSKSVVMCAKNLVHLNLCCVWSNAQNNAQIESVDCVYRAYIRRTSGVHQRRVSNKFCCFCCLFRPSRRYLLQKTSATVLLIVIKKWWKIAIHDTRAITLCVWALSCWEAELDWSCNGSASSTNSNVASSNV